MNDFSHFAGLQNPVELRTITRAHVIAWRKELEVRELSPATIRRKLSALSSLFDYLCERNAVVGNPVDGVKRPLANGNEGSTPALGDAQARKLLEAPPAEVVKLSSAKKGFVLLPRRWVVERTFGWAARFRRLVRDFERLPETVAGMHFVAFACLFVKRAFPAAMQS